MSSAAHSNERRRGDCGGESECGAEEGKAESKEVEEEGEVGDEEDKAEGEDEEGQDVAGKRGTER